MNPVYTTADCVKLCDRAVMLGYRSPTWRQPRTKWLPTRRSLISTAALAAPMILVRPKMPEAAITTLNGVVAGMEAPLFVAKAVTPTLVAGKPQSLWGLGGLPSAGGYSASLAGVALTASVTGQIPFTNPGAGNTYLARFVAQATQPGILMLCDRLWHNGGFTITTTGEQTLSSATWPARDANGATTGVGVLVWLEISSGAGAAAPVCTLYYTNTVPTGSLTGTNINPTANSPSSGSVFMFAQSAGDVGITSVQGAGIGTSWLSGTMNLFGFTVLGVLEMPVANTPNAIDAVTGGMPRIYNSAVPFLIFIPNTTTATYVDAAVYFTSG